MSARNPDSTPASLSPINRESELRTDAAKLDQLWQSAQIIHLVDARLSAADDSLTFIDAAAVAAHGGPHPVPATLGLRNQLPSGKSSTVLAG